MSTAITERTKQRVFSYFLKLTDQPSRIKQLDCKGISAQFAARAYGVLGQSYRSGMSGRDRLAPWLPLMLSVLGHSVRGNQVPGHLKLGAHTPLGSICQKTDSCPASG